MTQLMVPIEDGFQSTNTQSFGPSQPVGSRYQNIDEATVGLTGSGDGGAVASNFPSNAASGIVMDFKCWTPGSPAVDPGTDSGWMARGWTGKNTAAGRNLNTSLEIWDGNPSSGGTKINAASILFTGSDVTNAFREQAITTTDAAAIRAAMTAGRDVWMRWTVNQLGTGGTTTRQGFCHWLSIELPDPIATSKMSMII